ncbi:ribbon-helix-helix domain-containing protein [Sphingomonas naphthae]|uniref:Ribbon-helix-helix domain-containing protein n=1 Tax=Sphingomonas naphthae TaxID=1813468 RepID=A0ABY7TNA1_9SPHN|nr:CopG family transcriptional regulator [Sphingomonas naphthae]WCT74717.1 ribbon-helix-helix domain-containing protein [Sphingomonas naphthae]
MRTLVDIPEAQIRRLDVRAKSAGRSRAALIREAIDRMLGPEEVLNVDQVFGLWGDQAMDGVEYQRRIRAEWDREWDPD